MTNRMGLALSEAEAQRMELRQSSLPKRVLRTVAYTLGGLHPISPKNTLEGVDVCGELGACGVPSTLGKFSKAGDDPARYVQELRLASDSVRGSAGSGQFYLSVKPPTFFFQLDHAVAIATTALSNGHGVHFDSHGHDVAQPTIDLLRELMDQDLPASPTPRSWRFGLTIPTIWRRSFVDARWSAERGVRVRLVKGEFKAGSRSEAMDATEGYLSLVDQLAGSVPEIAVATHDYPLAREAISRCKAAGTSVELELLFGMPASNMIALAIEMDVPVRFYVPYGETLLVYGIRHMVTHPRKLLRPNSLEVVSSCRGKLTRVLDAVQTRAKRSSVAGATGS